MGFVPNQFGQWQLQPPPPPPEVQATGPPPPPPLLAPAPPPTTVVFTGPRTPTFTYSVPPSHMSKISLMPEVGFHSQPPVMIPSEFDASKPPPPLPINGQAQKRSMSETQEAGPRKIRKTEGAEDVDSLCNNCVQREYRIELTQQEIQKLKCEEEYQNEVYKTKLEEYLTGREMLKASINSQHSWVVDHYFEMPSQEEEESDIRAQCSQALSSLLPSSSILNNASELHKMLAAVQKKIEANNTSSGRIQGLLESFESFRNRAGSSREYPSAAPRCFASGGSAPPAASSVPALAPTPIPTAYLPYPPAIPPPANVTYQPYSSTGTNAALARMAAPPAAALPTTSACLPAPPGASNGVTYTHQYSSWRYPSPAFYPPQ